MPVACPHCGGSVEQADLSAKEILCPACGSSFRLEQNSTVDWDSSRGPRTLGNFELIETYLPCDCAPRFNHLGKPEGE